MTRTLPLSLLALVCSLSACTEDAASSPERGDAVVRAAEPAATPDGAGASGASTTATTADVVVPADWRTWMQSEVDAVAERDPALYDDLMALQPAPTRAGTLRLRGDRVRRPEAAAVLLYRLTSTSASPQVRAALVEALPRTGADVGAAVADLMTTETDAAVREMLAETLWRSQVPAALDGLRRGLGDAQPAVRAAAVRAAARHVDGGTLSGELVAALSDTDDATRMEAIRAVGALKIDAAKQPLADMLTASDADLRLASLRALGRVDAQYVATLPQLSTLQGDDDARVAATAAELAAK